MTSDYNLYKPSSESLKNKNLKLFLKFVITYLFL